jgi:hypothetical protein
LLPFWGYLIYPKNCNYVSKVAQLAKNAQSGHPVQKTDDGMAGDVKKIASNQSFYLSSFT